MADGNPQNEPILVDDENEDKFNKKDCSCCCKFCSEDIMYGFTFPGRLIMTFYSFQALFFFYNFIIYFIFLLPGMLFYTDSLIVIFLVCLLYVFFASLCSNILILPTYEFLLFSFIRHKNILAHLESLKVAINIIHNKGTNDTNKIEFRKSYVVLDVILIIIEILYAIGFILGNSSSTIRVKDIVREIIYIIIYFYYFVIFFGYFFVSLDLKFNLYGYIKDNPNNRNYIKNILFYVDVYINDFFNGKSPLPKNNLMCYVINPLLSASYEPLPEFQDLDTREDCFNTIRYYICCKCCGEKCGKCCKNWFHSFKNTIRAISFIISLIVSIIIMIKQDSDAYVYVLIPIFFAIFYSLSSLFNFPYIIRNKKVFFLFSTKYKYKKEYSLLHPIIVGLIRLVSFLIILLVSIGLLYVYLFKQESNNLGDIKKKEKEFKPEKETEDKTKLKPNICFSSIHDMYIHLYLPFINDAYYYEDDPKLNSSFYVDSYKQLFFDTETFDIDVIGNLIDSKESNKVKMIQYDVTKYKIEEDKSKSLVNEITILSIKGTTNKKDIYLDIQLYLPSVLLNFLSSFSLLAQRKDTYSFGYLEYSFSLPYRFFSQYFIIDNYLKDLLNAYNNNKSKFKKNVVIVGHSLGGGLSKIFGRFLGKQAISLSGPGVNAFHSLWEYEGSSENFEISAIDLVPDMDLVPRVEVSGGTIYRIVCKEGILDCHGKELSLCEVLTMCREPNYKNYCDEMTDLEPDQIKEIEESSKLNDNS